MESTSRLARDHQVTLNALEVLRLIGDRLEHNQAVDLEDIHFVFRFLTEVSHHCLDNTEELLLRPALGKPAAAKHSTHLGTALVNHRQVRTLFGELREKLDSPAAGEFVFLSRMYTSLHADIIFDESEFLPGLVRSVFTDAEAKRKLDEFDAIEHPIGVFAAENSGRLRRLEKKYISPHCI